jgi:hypothetical protein
MSLRSVLPLHPQTGVDWAIYFFVNIASTLVRTERFGAGTNTTLDSVPVAFVSLDCFDNGFGMLSTRRCYAVHNNVPGYNSTAYVPVADGMHMFCIRYSAASGAVTFGHGATMAEATIAPTSGIRGDIDDLFMNGTGAAFADFINTTDRWIYFHNYLPTLSEHAELLAGKSFAQTVADTAPPPSGTGSGGGDMWDLARQALGG